MLKLMNLCAALVDDYKVEFPINYMSYPWVQLINDFTGEYYGYLQLCEDSDEATDFRVISDNILFPFLQAAMELRNTVGYDTYGSRNVVGFVADIRKQINEIEVHCKYYAKDLEEQYKTYFSDQNANIIQLKDLKTKIENLL